MAGQELMISSILPGQRLKAAREAAGMSLESVAQQLRLSMTIMRALEADDYERLPEPAFVKGYLRNYARLVSLPADDIANLYQQIQAEEPAPEPEQPESSAPGLPRWALVAVALFAGVLLLLLVSGEDEPVQDAVVAPEQEQVDEVVTPALPETEGDAPAVETPAVPEVDEAGALQAPAAGLEEVTEEPVAPASDRLAISFLEICWVKVVDAGDEQVYSGQKAAGSTLRVEGQAPFRITLGNAAAVEQIRVNDDIIPVPASTPGRVVVVRTP